jgi:hypothetical protein
MPLRNLLVRVGADVSNMAKGLDQANRKLKKFADNVNASMGGIQGRIAGALAGLGAGLVIKEATADAIRYEALMGTLGESMGKNMADFTKWRDSVGASMGYSKLQAADLANTLSLNFKKIAVDQKDLVDKTTKMMEVAAIVANKRGMAMTEVSDRIRSAMNQEADGADELGVNVRVAAIEQSNAYKMLGASGPWDKLSEQMRKNILYHHILEQVSTNLGDSLQDNTQIKLAQFTASLGDVKLALGQAFLPILSVVLPVLTVFMRKLESAFQYVAAFSASLFGKSFGGKATVGLKNTTKATLGQTSAMNKLGDATEKAGKKAKKAAKEGENLQSFDEVHLLAQKAGTGSGGGAEDDVGAGGIEAPPMLENPLGGGDPGILVEITAGMKKLTDRIKEFFATSEGWKTLKDSVVGVWKSLKDLYASDVIQSFIKNFAEDLPAFFDDLMLIAGGVFKNIGGAIDILNGLINGSMYKTWMGMGKMFSGLWDIFAGTVGLIFPNLGDALDKFGDRFDEAWVWFGQVFVFRSKTWGEAWDKFCTRLKDEILKAIRSMGDEITRKFDEMKIKMIKKVWEAIVDMDAKFQKFKKDCGTVLTWIKDNSNWIFETIKNIVKQKMSDAWNEFKKPFSGAYSFFKTNVIDPIYNAFNSIKNAFGGSITAGFTKVYNTAVGWLNDMIKSINKIKIPGVWEGVNITAIPKLAKGGIATGPTLAVVGEGRSDEAIAPIDKLQGYIASAVLDALKFTAPQQASGDVILNIDGKQFARIVKPFIDRETKRVGNNVRIQGT